MLTTTIRVQGLSQLEAALSLAPEVFAVENERAMVIATHVAEGEIKALTPRKTGRLFSAWETGTSGAGFAVVGMVGDPVSYAPFVEEDTGPHDIVARGTALMLPVSGGGFGGGRLSGSARSGQQVAFFKKIKHPGTKGKHMAERGAEAARPLIVAEFMAAARRTFEFTVGRLGGIKNFLGG